MDKCTIIRLLEGGRSKRSVAKELNIHRSIVTKYWKEYLQKKNKSPLILRIQVKKSTYCGTILQFNQPNTEKIHR